jgi:hypothetical protein
MTGIGKQLLEIIRTHNNSEKALETAMKIILEFLEQDESSREPLVVCSQESA